MKIAVRLEITPQRLGGVRWWCRCPLGVDGKACGRRVRLLYLPPGQKYFGCRSCHGLTYRSAQEHDKRVDALLRDPQALHQLADQAMEGIKIPAVSAFGKLLLVAKAEAKLLRRFGKLVETIPGGDHPRQGRAGDAGDAGQNGHN